MKQIQQQHKKHQHHPNTTNPIRFDVDGTTYSHINFKSRVGKKTLEDYSITKKSPSHITTTPLSRGPHPPSHPTRTPHLLSHTYPIHRFLSLNSQTDSGSGFDTFLSTHILSLFVFLFFFFVSLSLLHPRILALANHRSTHRFALHFIPHSSSPFCIRLSRLYEYSHRIITIIHTPPIAFAFSHLLCLHRQRSVFAYRPRHRPSTVTTHRPPD